MEPLTEQQIRAAFVNCSKGEAKRLAVPKDLATRPWPDLDFFGWRDPQAADRAYLVIPSGTTPTGIMPTGTTPTGIMPTSTTPTSVMPTGTTPSNAMPTGAMPTGGGLRAIALRCPTPSTIHPRRSMCSICLTTHTGGVSLMVAAKAGKEGKLGNTVGTYLCADLACSLYLRGIKELPPGDRLKETITVPEKIARATANLAAFLAKVIG